MTGKREEQEKNKPRKEKARVCEGRELIERRKGTSDRLFVPEIDLNSDELRIYALELLSAKVKRQISSKNHLYLLSKVTARIFLPIKARKSLLLDHIALLNVGSIKPPAFNEDTFHLSKAPRTCLGQMKSLGNR